MRYAAAIVVALAAAPAAAQEQEARDLCADRPGANDSPCTIAPGRLQLETGFSWTRSEDGADRVDDFAIGDLNLRVGLDASTELRLGWTALGISDVRGAGGSEGVGDLLIGLRRNLVNPDGASPSVAIQGYVSLPTGTGPLRSGDWGAGVALPLSVDLSPRLSFGATPRLNAAVDADGDGRHVALGTSAGLGLSLTDTLGATVDLSVMQDDDPAGSITEAAAGLSLAWQVGEDAQLDLGAAAGLNRDTADLELAAGVVLRF